MIRVKQPPPPLIWRFRLTIYHIYLRHAPPYLVISVHHTRLSAVKAARSPRPGLRPAVSQVKRKLENQQLVAGVSPGNLVATCPCTSSLSTLGWASYTSLTGVPWSELLVTPALGYPGTPGLPSLSVSFTCEGNGQLLRFPEGRHLELSHVRHWHSERWLARRQDADRPLLNRVEH